MTNQPALWFLQLWAPRHSEPERTAATCCVFSPLRPRRALLMRRRPWRRRWVLNGGLTFPRRQLDGSDSTSGRASIKRRFQARRIRHGFHKQSAFLPWRRGIRKLHSCLITCGCRFDIKAKPNCHLTTRFHIHLRCNPAAQ